ncbi:hypothetical protein YPPY94_4434, partial [Yersinia pestis PY-94]
MISAG